MKFPVPGQKAINCEFKCNCQLQIGSGFKLTVDLLPSLKLQMQLQWQGSHMITPLQSDTCQTARAPDHLQHHMTCTQMLVIDTVQDLHSPQHVLSQEVKLLLSVP